MEATRQSTNQEVVVSATIKQFGLKGRNSVLAIGDDTTEMVTEANVTFV